MDRVFIIAEAGVNHGGDIDIAKRMIEVASEAGADAVKFQTFKVQEVMTKTAAMAPYQRKAASSFGSQFEMVKNLQLDKDAHLELLRHCQKKSIVFLSTPFNLDSVDLLNDLGMRIFKIPSGEITNLPLLRKIGALRKKVLLSTGMAKMNEISGALSILIKSGTPRKDIIVLHCTTAYPASLKDVNLLAMLAIKDKFRVEVGYSDHTLGIEVSLAAVALGARVIEKHFTLDRNMPGPDQKSSLEPAELKKMVAGIRNIEMALGNGIKRPSPSELRNIRVIRKSIVAAQGIRRGEIFTPSNITTKRPARGLSPMRWDKVIGRSAKRDFSRDEAIEI